MPKTKNERKQEAVVRALDSSFVGPEKPCSTCKYHTNKPSYCKKLTQFVGRKHTCEEYHVR